LKLDDKLHWYKDAIIYELHIKAFFDSNDDGIGDFAGLMEKLDYLEDLGVTAIWLLPFYPSPLRDDGYDIADYYSVNPSYGEVNDLKKLIKEAHKRGLRIITELVINHTSDKHPWFERARNAPKGSSEREYYVWTDDPDQYRDARIIFQDYEASNWTWDPVAEQYYWHRFFHHQPDLNFDNQKVREEVFKILEYWCEMGVDGFRLDAVPYLFERDGTNCENLPETHKFLKELRAKVDESYPGTLLLAEANMWPEDSASYFGDGDECQMNYHFPVMPRMFMALNMEDRYPITDIFDQTPEIPETCQWAIFLRNHDELTLEMVTDEERDYMYKVYAKNPRAKINLGIRQRLAPLMNNDRRKIELLNYLLFSLPGTPVIYYGDEIGMGDNFYLGDRDGVRTPMQWSPDRNGGFSKANPQKLYLPSIMDPEYTFEAINVETQRRNTSSLFWWMKRMINMRKKYKAFGRGDLKFLRVENSKVMAFTRTYEDETILVVVNLSRFSQAAEIDLGEFTGFVPTELFSKNEFPEIKEGQDYSFTMTPYAYHWFYLENVHAETEVSSRHTLKVAKGLTGILAKKPKAELESKILPGFLKGASWFAGKGRKMQNLEIVDSTELMVDDEPTLFLNIRADFDAGMSDHYLLPLSFTSRLGAEHIVETYPEAVVADFQTEDEEGLLYDAFYGSSLQKYLFENLLTSKEIKLKKSKVAFESHVDDDNTESLRPKVTQGHHSNTLIQYGGKYILKVYRKLDTKLNPDLELNKFLHQKVNFEHVPAYLGSIMWKQDGDPIVMGMLQRMVENNGDAAGYMSDLLQNYYDRILSTNKDELSLPNETPNLTEAVSFEKLSEQEQVLLGLHGAERAGLLGQRTAEMHQALASDKKDPDFKPEEFSLHYQRSLYSSFQTLVRSSFEKLNKGKKKLSENVRAEADEVLKQRTDLMDKLKEIYAKKFDVVKIRCHGDFHLGQVLFTGRDFVFIDFEGEPSRSISERRLKRSPLRDIASMIRSFHYAAYGAILLNEQYSDDEIERILPWAEVWYKRMAGFFLKSYIKHLDGNHFIPEDQKDFEVLLNTFLIEKAVYELQWELDHRPDWVAVPLRGLKDLMG
jgi:maltose alpha-D-glucosyltransferase/alpha-amylase